MTEKNTETIPQEIKTPAARRNWWLSLENQWKCAFNQAVLQKGEVPDMPTDEEMEHIIATPALRVVGPRGSHPSVRTEVTNLSGCKHLLNLETLVITYCKLTSLEEITHLTSIKALFVNNNQIISLKGVENLTQVETFFANSNKLTSIKEVKKLTSLKSFYCNYNQIDSLKGISKVHRNKLQQLVCLPNEKLPMSEVLRVESKHRIKCFKG